MDIEVPGYRLDRLIAEGGMASVYLAVQESLNRNVALKLLKKFDAPAETERFLNEGRIISSLNHRNIITIHDIGLVGERPFISMEFLEGGDLEDRLGKGVEADTALSLLETLAECLEFVHRHGIIHRDIKPANILFHADGTPILTDFGIAKELQADTSLTIDGTAIGSPHYLSPEQAECKPLSGRADIYSLGVVFYQMLVGARPFEGDSAVAVIVAHLSDPVPQLPPAQERYQPLIDRMMAKAPEERFASTTELLASIRELRTAGPPISGSEKSQAPYSRSRAWVSGSSPRRVALGVAGTGVATVVMLSALGTPWWPRGAQPVAAPATPVMQIGNANDGAEQRIAKLSGPEIPAESSGASVTPGSPANVPSAAGNQRSHKPVATTKREKIAEPRGPVELKGIADPSRQRQVDRYLRSARAALAEYRLTTPRGDNAHFYLRRALELAPDNREAQQGLATVADTYAELVEGALDRFDYVKAKRYLGRGLSVQPENQRLLGLKSRTDAHRDAPKRLVNKVRSWF